MFRPMHAQAAADSSTAAPEAALVAAADASAAEAAAAEARASAAPPALPPPPAGTSAPGTGADAPRGLKQRVHDIRDLLDLDPGLKVPEVVTTANKAMGIEPQHGANLADQVEKLIHALGLRM
jgi:hypothetical protein